MFYSMLDDYMNFKKMFVTTTISFLLLIIIVLATLAERYPEACVDTEGNCDYTNINADEETYEALILQTEPGYSWINATDFNETIPAGAIINNVTIHVQWRNQVLGKGAGNQYISYWNTTDWVDCAGPLTETVTWTDTYCIDQEGNFSTVNSINNINVSMRGQDIDGGPSARLYVDIMNITVNYTPATDVTYLVMMPTDWSAHNFTINATTEEDANETDWISFNVSSLPATDVQPYRQGIATDNQDGNDKPIFYIDNVGNVNINISLRFNASLPGGISITANATCTGCAWAKSGDASLGTSYVDLIKDLQNDTSSFANVSLWGDFTTSAPGGETGGYSIYINATNTTLPS